MNCPITQDYGLLSYEIVKLIQKRNIGTDRVCIYVDEDDWTRLVAYLDVIGPHYPHLDSYRLPMGRIKLYGITWIRKEQPQ